MMRRSLYPGSPHAFALVSAGSGVSFQQRTVGKGKSSTVASGSGAVPVWLRIVRKGSQFTASRSTDGATWKVMGTTTISMPSTIYVGLAVTSHNASARTTASFSGVAVKTTSTTTSNTLPTVSVTSPASGQTFTAPAVVTVTASAADSDGTISKVEFYRGTTLIGTDTSSPYSASTGSLSAGTYSLTAVAQDNAGGRRTSAAVSITVATSTTAAPKTLTFTPSADHANVTKYVFEVFKAGWNPSTSTPVKTQDLGKPSVVNGLISVNVETTIQALSSGSYFATVRAVNAAGWTRSAPSNTFTR
jgi:chitinase